MKLGYHHPVGSWRGVPGSGVHEGKRLEGPLLGDAGSGLKRIDDRGRVASTEVRGALGAGATVPESSNRRINRYARRRSTAPAHVGPARPRAWLVVPPFHMHGVVARDR